MATNADTLCGPNAGQLLRDARQRSGLTLRALAGRAGTSHTALAAYEAGRKTPGFGTLRRVLEACGFAMEVRLTPRIRERNGLERGDELVQVLRLADAFPVKGVPDRIQKPAFPG